MKWACKFSENNFPFTNYWIWTCCFNVDLLFMPFPLPSSIFLVRLLLVDLDLKLQTDNVKQGRFENQKDQTRAIRTALGTNVTMTLTTTGWQTKRTTARRNPTRWAWKHSDTTRVHMMIMFYYAVVIKDLITKGPRRHRWWWGRRSLRQLSFRFQCSAAGELKFQFLTSLSSMSWFEVTCCQQCHKSPNHWTAFIVICDSSKVAWIFWHNTTRKKETDHIWTQNI